MVSTFAAFADNQQVHNLDITVTLRASGAAEIQEVWDIDTGYDITEWYLVRENLGDIQIRDFSVYDEDYEGGRRFQDSGEWDIDLSRRQKTGRSGIVHKSSGVELCWGIGDYGHHVFHVSYLMTNAVKTLDDYDMLHLQLVSPGLAAPPKNVRVRICTADEVGAQLDTTNTRVWGFGFYGTSSFEADGSVVYASTQPFIRNSSVIALLRFEKGLFQSPSIQERDFEDVLDRAMEGADFGPREEAQGSDENDGNLRAIFNLLIYAASILFGRRAWMKGTGRVTRAEKKRLLGGDEKAIPWHRDIPMDGDLIAADYALTRLGADRKKNALASAEILRMIYRGQLDVQKDANGKIEISFAKDGADLQFPDSIGHDLWSMMLDASGEDRVLQDKEFSAWSRKHRKRLYNWTEKITLMGKSRFQDKGWMGTSSKRFTPAGQKEAQNLLGFKKFLEGFTLTSEREAIEAHLWQDYLVFGALLGVADKVAKQLKDIDPVLFEQTVGYDYTTLNSVLYSMDSLSRAITSSNRAYLDSIHSSSGSGGSWGGFGGGTSFGGGGGFSGGGFGGGGR